MNSAEVQQLKQRNALLESIFYDIPTPTLYMDRQFRLILVNKAFAKMAGHAPGFFARKGYFDLYPDEGLEAVFKRVLKTAEPYTALEDTIVHIPREGGEPETYWDWSVQPVKDGRNRVIGLVLQFMEVTEQRRTREKWKAYRAGLEQSNRELGDFAHTASHDLQEPLRKICSFGRLLTRQYSRDIGPEGRDYLERMVLAANRMQHLIEALLLYSRVTTQAQPFQPVDLNSSLEEALSNLENRIQVTRGRVDIGMLPTIEADGSQMIQLFQNLVGNALKFHREGAPPVIRVMGTPVQNQDTQEGTVALSSEVCRIVVTDNGIGFDEIHLERIFSPFQRLHGRSEYDGVGMGLSICRRIVERHGGRITARSTRGKGSTFIVDLPLSRPISDLKCQSISKSIT
jgi:PAS domain S-box-containing protein